MSVCERTYKERWPLYCLIIFGPLGQKNSVRASLVERFVLFSLLVAERRELDWSKIYSLLRRKGHKGVWD